MSHFHWPGFEPPRDNVVELVYPSAEAATSLVANSRHPLVRDHLPDYFEMTMAELKIWMPRVGFGRSIPPKLGCPIYWFWINRTCESGEWDIVGDMQLRIHDNPSAIMASGHVGYHVLPQFWNRGYMTRALTLAKRVFRSHGMSEIILTCRPDNWASARVAEKAGGRLLEIREFSEAEKSTFQISDSSLCRYALSTHDGETNGA